MRHGLEVVTDTPTTSHVNQKKMKRIFPCSTQPFLRDLPINILIKLGTEQFKPTITWYFNNKCWHRIQKKSTDCSKCMSSYNIDAVKMEAFYDEYYETVNDLETQNILNYEYLEIYDRKALWSILCLEQELLG